MRKLYLVRPAGGRVFQHEAVIEAFMQRMIAKLATAVGELVRPGKAGAPDVRVAAGAG